MIPLRDLAPGYSIPRVILGGWQLSEGHSPAPVDRDAQLSLWDAALDLGANTFDCADIYTGVESLIGELVARRRRAGLSVPQIHTKLVPDRGTLATLDRRAIEAIVDRSLRRLGVERLDLIQFHWWDCAIPGYLDALAVLDDLRRDGRIRLLGLTNFDGARLREIAATGMPIASLQLQYSVLDQRPARGLDRVATGARVALLCYGSLAGGFLSERWLGRPSPEQPGNRSLVKYRLIIEDGGGWDWFQGVLRALDRVARGHGVGIPEVATAWVLGRPGVAAAIVGVRRREHLERVVRSASLVLSDADRATIAEATGPSPGPVGDVYQAERVPGGKHGAIMRYDLNSQAEP